jgi:hypothetical protein
MAIRCLIGNYDFVRWCKALAERFLSLIIMPNLTKRMRLSRQQTRLHDLRLTPDHNY